MSAQKNRPATEPGQKRRGIATAGNITFELHTLGWEAFQNLCGHIAREILGQTVTTFSATNDAGQDGAFQGTWKRNKKESYEGRFILQCKFTARRDQHLSISDLNDEILKATRLGNAGLAQTYLLITNAKISGASDLAIRAAFSNISGVQSFDILGEEWITQSILRSKSLRAFVPRVYGLGDLSQIIDERVYRQANEILQSWKDNLSKFVPTAAHERSVRALIEKGFVLLLGDPMAGKSTIAAALALAAADRWGCSPVFVRDPSDIKHWNPDEPNQFFWVDDAFGQIQMESHLTASWNHVMPHLTAAVRKGAKVLFTSRTYVYRAALKELKTSAFPLIKDSQVIINVEKLTETEKERILYNHLRLGQQTKEYRKSLKPYLPHVAANPKFFPEVAKRLSDPFFTKNLRIIPSEINRFVEEPKQFLYDIISELDKPNFASLCLLFMRGGKVAIPPRIDPTESDSIEMLGANLSTLCDAFNALDGSLVSQVFEAGEKHWQFRHPSVRDAMALHVADRPELLDIYLGGVKASELLSEVVCGDVQIAGAKVHVPENRFQSVLSPIGQIDFNDWWQYYSLLGFLVNKCSSTFIRQWVEKNENQLLGLYNYFSVSNHQFSLLLSRLHNIQKLPPAIHSRYVRDTETQAVSSAIATFLAPELRNLLTSEEFTTIMGRVKDEVVPVIDNLVDNRESDYDDVDQDPSDHFDELRSNFSAFENYFINSEDDTEDNIYYAFVEGKDYIQSAVDRITERNEDAKREKEEEEEKERKELEERERQDAEETERLEEAMTKTMRQERKRESESRAEINLIDRVIPVSRSIFDDVDE